MELAEVNVSQDMQNAMDITNSAEKCSDVVRTVMHDYKLFDNQATVELIQSLKEEENLRFGEIMLLFLLYLKPRVTPHYFLIMCTAGRRLETLYDEYVRDISYEEVETMMKDASTYKSYFCMCLYRRVKESAYKINNKGLDKKKNIDLFGSSRLSYKEYVASATFSSNYECPTNIRFETFFKYWLFSKQDQYSEAFFKTSYSACNKLEPLFNRPYRLVRSSDVLKCINGHTLSQKNHVIGLYRALDKYAYEKDLIPKQYGKNLKPYKIFEKNNILFTSEDVQSLLDHRGEISVDIALVFLFTGIALREISCLEGQNVDEQHIHLLNGSTKSSRRRIPIHPFIKESLKRVIDFKTSLGINGVLEERHKLRIKRMVVKATEKYCNRSYSPLDCRRSFTNQLLVTGATRVTVEYLRGTQRELIKLHERMYIHSSTECLNRAIMNLSWGGDR